MGFENSKAGMGLGIPPVERVGTGWNGVRREELAPSESAEVELKNTGAPMCERSVTTLGLLRLVSVREAQSRF
jgi:hypothetical protein